MAERNGNGQMQLGPAPVLDPEDPGYQPIDVCEWYLLKQHTTGVALTEDEQEQVVNAAGISAVLTLVKKGVDVDQAGELIGDLIDRGQVHISWNAKDGLSIVIGEEDDRSTHQEADRG